jgi:hypothetical protein
MNKYIGLYWGCVIIIFTDIEVHDQKSSQTTAVGDAEVWARWLLL